MSGGAGPIIIRRNMRVLADSGSVKDQLGPRKRAKLEAVLAKAEEDWTHREEKFVLDCVGDALEAYEA
jgi:hypothetical protein